MVEHTAGWKRNLYVMYGITDEEWHEVLKRQGGKCALPTCERPPDYSQWATDHCHHTRSFRGILCLPHNNGLGMFHDNPIELAEAFEYLSAYRGQQMLEDIRNGK